MPTILIVDDSPVNLKIIRQLLGSEYEALAADNGRMGLQLTRKNCCGF